MLILESCQYLDIYNDNVNKINLLTFAWVQKTSIKDQRRRFLPLSTFYLIKMSQVAEML